VVAGLDASVIAANAMPKPRTSVPMWAASDINAKEFTENPTMNSTTM
jgi:hypothetical protein